MSKNHREELSLYVTMLAVLAMRAPDGKLSFRKEELDRLAGTRLRMKTVAMSDASVEVRFEP